MPHKKGKKKTTPKHKKKGVKIITKHKICPDNQPTYKKRKNITNITKKEKVSQDSLMKINNNKKRRLPVEVMPSSSYDNVRVIDNLPELKTFNTSTVNTSISGSITNLTQAKKIREQVWIHHNGKKFETKCYVTWCTNIVDVFNFQVGHDTPKALGGSNELLNLKPICQNCNQSMGSRYSIAEWNQLFAAQRRQISTMSSRENFSIDIIKPIEYEKIDLSSNIFANQQPINILPELTLIRPYQLIEMQTEKLQTENTQPRNMCYGPLARFMPVRANRSLIIQSAVGVMALVGAWIFGA